MLPKVLKFIPGKITPRAEKPATELQVQVRRLVYVARFRYDKIKTEDK